MGRQSGIDWGHGYYTAVPYAAGFFRETTPIWLDFAARIGDQCPPRRREGEPFRYLDLGCGMGFGLCLLAGLYPEGSFLGVDFNPDHIGHARQLAEELELTNIRFLEADFLELQRDPSPLGEAPADRGPYQYVVAHGIASWVGPAVREALLAVGAAALADRGLFYLSYNCQPGWLALSNYQQLVKLELRRSGGQPSTELFQQVADRLLLLVGDPQQPNPLGRFLPTLPQELIDLPQRGINYLYGEFGHEQWQPLAVGDLHLLARGERLTPIGTATLPELFDDLVAPSLRETVLGESEPLLRQTLLDLATFKGFRRDIFVRGRVPLGQAERSRRLGAVRLRLLEAPPLQAYDFNTTFGLVRGNPEVYRAVEAALASSGRCIDQLMAACEQPLPELERIVALLLHEGRLALDRGAAGEAAAAGCERLNGRLLLRLVEGWPYTSLAAAPIGTGVPLNLIEAEALLGLGNRPADAAWARQLQARLDARRTSSAPGEGSEPGAELLSIASTFQQQRLPWWQRLGIVAPAA
ncbi:MAG: class I SAM-dependent methyltransferase [Cyanobium sp.]|nr:class I SAM-dependent methyltransferase [Cyanobium sp.]